MKTMKLFASIIKRLKLYRQTKFIDPSNSKAIGEEAVSSLNGNLRPWTVDEVATLIEQCIIHQSSFDKANSKKLASIMKLRAVPEGGIIILQGKSKGAGLYLILTGHVAVERAAHGTVGSKVVAIAGPGDFIGEMQLIDGRPRSASCIAQTDVQLAALSERQYKDLPRTNPGAAMMLNSIISRQQTERLRKATFRSLFLENLLNASERDFNL